MAIKYFDLNGSTAGFGTLTGAWNTAGAAFWSDSSAGTAVPANYTFTSADTSAFGFTGTTATAGTATIAAGLTITVNSISTANLAGLQTIAAGAGGTLSLVLDGATVPSINVGSAGGLTISSAITGSAGFTKAGAGTLTLTNVSVVTPNTITGQISVTGAGGFSGPLALGTSAAPLVPTSVLPGTGGVYPSVSVSAANDWVRIYSTGTNVTFNNQFLGNGVVNISTNSATPAGPNFAATTLSGMEGTSNGTGTGAGIAPQSGLVLQATTSSNRAIVSAADVPATVGYYLGPTSTTTATFKYTGTLVSPGLRKIWIGAYVTPALSTSTISLEANQPNINAPLTLDLGILKDNDAGGTATFTLDGTHPGNNTVSGPISATAGTLGITKAGIGRWILSGANTYTGTTTISAGTLAGNSTSAFGTSAGTTSVITQTGGTLEFGAVVNKGTNAVTLLSLAGATAVSSPTGTTGLTCAGVALSTAATIFDVAAGTFTLTNSAAMSGVGFGISKIGAGEYVIASTVANTFTGAVSVSAGTLTIIGAAAPSSNGPLGNAATGVALTGTMKYAGTGAATISRSMTFTGAAPALEAAGTTSAAAVTFSAFTHAAGARTVTFKGDNAGDNTFSAVLNDNGASVVGLTKSGASKWILSAQPTYTGLTTVSAGELQFNELNLSNNLTVNGTGKLSKTVLTGSSKTITCDGGTPEIVATTSVNTVTGTTSVTAGTLRLTTDVSASSKPVTVLGTTDVTVSALAAIRTSTGNTQAGKMRYGGNLTFNANSSLYIGG